MHGLIIKTHLVLKLFLQFIQYSASTNFLLRAYTKARKLEKHLNLKFYLITGSLFLFFFNKGWLTQYKRETGFNKLIN